MHRVLYLFLPNWAIDRLRRAGLLPSLKPGAPPAEEAPFATVMAAARRQMLAVVNPAAAAKGIAAGMPLADALSFLPGLLTRPAELAEDAAALRRLAEWCSRYSPWTAPDSENGIKIEITGSAHLWGGEQGLATDLSRRLSRQGIAHRLAVADALGAAWAVARYAVDTQKEDPTRCKSAVLTAKFIVPSGESRAALEPLPVAALRLDPAIVEGLHRVGLRRVGEVMAMPRDALARRFSETVARRLDQALGELPEPLSPLGEVPSRRVRLSLPEPISDPATLARAAERLTLDLVSRLAREGMGARRLDLGFHRVDGRVEHIRIGTARPSRDPVHLAKLLVGKLDTIDPGLGIEDVILAAFAVEKLPPEQIGMSGAAGASGDTAPLFDRLGARLGLDAIARLEPRESHIPERASVAVPIGIGNDPIGRQDGMMSPSPPLGAERAGPRMAAREGGRSGGRWGKRRRMPTSPSRACGVGPSLSPQMGGEEFLAASQKTPRPVRLFAPPEPVEAFWVLPDDPPFRFTWRHRTHRVARADGPERIAEEWWRPDGQLVDANGSPDAIRDYYRVEDASGRRFWLFRAGLPGNPPPRWFVHGVFA